MMISKNFSFVLLALSKLIVADSEKFGFLALHSGTDLQFSTVYNDGGELMVGSSSDSLYGTITDAGKLSLSDNTYAVVKSDGPLVEGSESDATSGFSIKDGYLAYNDLEGFFAIKNGSAYVFSTSTATNATTIEIKAVASGSGSSVPDFPSSSSSGSSSSTSSSVETSTSESSTSATATSSVSESSESSASSTATSSVSESTLITSSAAAVSQTTDGQIQATQTENGAPKAAVGMLTGFVAAAAALLL